MREKWQKQRPLMPQLKDHTQCQELEAISRLIDTNPTICDLVLQDLSRGKIPAHRQGANGMSADQVLRCALVKTLFGFTYEELAFHLVDSQSLAWFCRIGIADDGFQKSALNQNIKAIRDTTWQQINAELLGHAQAHNIEKGRKVRIDCTVPIHGGKKPRQRPPNPLQSYANRSHHNVLKKLQISLDFGIWLW